MFDTSHPMLRPLWVRLLICLVSCGWALFEYLLGNVVWSTIFGAVGFLMVYILLLTYKPPKDEDA